MHTCKPNKLFAYLKTMKKIKPVVYSSWLTLSVTRRYEQIIYFYLNKQAVLQTAMSDLEWCKKWHYLYM